MDSRDGEGTWRLSRDDSFKKFFYKGKQRNMVPANGWGKVEKLVVVGRNERKVLIQ